jgi:hypothetical protein
MFNWEPLANKAINPAVPTSLLPSSAATRCVKPRHSNLCKHCANALPPCARRGVYSRVAIRLRCEKSTILSSSCSVTDEQYTCSSSKQSSLTNDTFVEYLQRTTMYKIVQKTHETRTIPFPLQVWNITLSYFIRMNMESLSLSRYCNTKVCMRFIKKIRWLRTIVATVACWLRGIRMQSGQGETNTCIEGRYI